MIGILALVWENLLRYYLMHKIIIFVVKDCKCIKKTVLGRYQGQYFCFEIHPLLRTGSKAI